MPIVKKLGDQFDVGGADIQTLSRVMMTENKKKSFSGTLSLRAKKQLRHLS